jgi:hypothetical protein
MSMMLVPNAFGYIARVHRCPQVEVAGLAFRGFNSKSGSPADLCTMLQSRTAPSPFRAAP